MKTEKIAIELLEALKRAGGTLATAESCTGGGIGDALTAIPGSSAAYCGGVISYTNAVKEQLLGVPSEILLQFGAVSEHTAKAMAEGVRHLLHTDYAVSVTGIAGPDGDGTGKPVGLVYIGCASEHRTVVREFHFSGGRTEVRRQAVESALQMVLEQM